MANDTYFKKYKKYKIKYLSLKNEKKINHESNHINRKKILLKYPFYFIHGTSYKSLISILKDGYIKLPKDTPAYDKALKAENIPLDHIFASMYFEDMKTMTRYPSHSLILSPNILADKNAIFNRIWTGDISDDAIILNRNDSHKTFKKKIQEIRKILGGDIYIPKESGLYGWMTHEILFSDELALKNNLLGIVCYDCNNEELKEVEKLGKKYGNIQIIQDKSYFPKLKDIYDI